MEEKAPYEARGEAVEGDITYMLIFEESPEKSALVDFLIEVANKNGSKLRITRTLTIQTTDREIARAVEELRKANPC